MESKNETHSPLHTLRSRLTVIRDRVRGVALRHHTGFYLYGRPGTSKTYTVKTTLDSLGVPYHYHIGHLTDLGLFEVLEENHDRILLLDDVSAIFKQRVALQLLLAALGRSPDDTGERAVKYRRQGRESVVRFTGGIVCISNLELHETPLLQALKSRVHYLRYEPTDEQIAALILEIASKGLPAQRPLLSSSECKEVAEFVIQESQRLKAPLDVRLFIDKALPDYHQHRSGAAETHWKDLVITTLEEQLVDLSHTTTKPKSRTETKAAEHQIILDILTEFSSRKDQRAAWSERTGKSGRAFERRLREIEAS